MAEVIDIGGVALCYSAQIEADYVKFVRVVGPIMGIQEFVELYWSRAKGAKVNVPKGLDVAFLSGRSEPERQIAAAIDQYTEQAASRLEQELFKQRARLATAERSLQTKTTTAATESRRIAGNKVDWIKGKLADLRRTELQDKDWRIFPGWYAPVLVAEGGRAVVKPMRYQCRPAGKPAIYDRKYPGTYNARRDNLEGFWKGQFGHSHGVIVVNAFYENVSRHKMEGRELAPGEKEQNVVLEFRPEPRQAMLVACLWSRWVGPDGEELLSFAAITDEPPPEVAAAGHDRCVIPIKPENLAAWLNPDPASLAASYAVLDDRARPYYEHRLAA